MRIITGIAKGKRLLSPNNFLIRPTTDRVKESIFSIVQFKLKNAKVLDLFSGTGQLGIEALSRGAQSCTFVDRLPYANKLQLKNLEIAGFLEKSKVILKSSLSFIQSTEERFDIIFLDPPYNSNLMLKSLEISKTKLEKDGIILCEHEKTLEMPKISDNITLQKQYVYGKIEVSCYANIN